MQHSQILIGVSDAAVRSGLASAFETAQFVVRSEGTSSALNAALRTRSACLVVVDDMLASPDDGFCAALRARPDGTVIPCILMAANSCEGLAIAALKAGINDYFKPPVSMDAVVAAAHRWIGSRQHACPPGRSPSPRPGGVAPMIGESRAMQDVRGAVERLAAFDSNVLITGETGTGKELAAHLIHGLSERQRKPFVPINCAALPDALVESELFGYERGAFTGAVGSYEGALKLADGGSAFFDEIGDMGLPAQAKVLRAIDVGEVQRLGARGRTAVDIRIIAATNQDLDSLVSQGRFRRDLYYRVDVARIQLPPLRDRKEDLPQLCAHYISQLNRKFKRSVESLGPAALESLLRYDWPGNVRELKHVLEAVFVNLPPERVIRLELPEPLRARLDPGVRSRERDEMLSALSATNWNKSKAAEKLHWSRMTLYRKMAKYHVSATTDPSSL